MVTQIPFGIMIGHWLQNDFCATLELRLLTIIRPLKAVKYIQVFIKLSNLTHRSFHLKIKNYFCKFCNMAFSQSGNARRHERRCASLDNINNGGGLKNEDGESGGEDENGGDGIKKEVKDEANNAADSAGEREAAVEKRKREVLNSWSYCMLD